MCKKTHVAENQTSRYNTFISAYLAQRLKLTTLITQLLRIFGYSLPLSNNVNSLPEKTLISSRKMSISLQSEPKNS